MNDLIVKIEKKTRKVKLEQIYLGNDHENLQENLVFQFDEFVDGQARLEYEINGNSNYIILSKDEEEYTIPVQNVLTIYQEETIGKIKFQLVVTEGTSQENIPVFKSNIFYLRCRPSINAVTEAPEGYELWIEQANAKLNAMDNFNITSERVQDGVEISITDRQGVITVTKVLDGANGATGNGIESITKTSTSGLSDTYTILYTDGNTTTFTVTNGAKGETGASGSDGKDGTNGQDGFSPVATVERITGGATISITDKNGTTTATVNDGQTQDISGKFDKNNVKSAYSTNSEDVYNVTYINTMIGNIETLLSGI